jgi:hypothetical protein
MKIQALPLLLGGALALSAAEPQVAADPAQQPVIEKPALAYVNSQTPSWLSLSGEFQFRYEGRQGLGYVAGNDATTQRTRVNIGVRPLLAAVLLPGQTPGARHPRRLQQRIFRDPFDVHQAYVKIGGNEVSVAFTAGNQLLNYGDQRLISPLDWTASRTFDALRLEVQASKDVKFDIFSPPSSEQSTASQPLRRGQ